MSGIAAGICKTCIYAYRCLEADRGVACTDYVKGRERRSTGHFRPLKASDDKVIAERDK